MIVFLSGHIHGGWRDHVRELAKGKGLDITFKGPCEDHSLSDNIGVKIRDSEHCEGINSIKAFHARQTAHQKSLCRLLTLDCQRDPLCPLFVKPVP